MTLGVLMICIALPMVWFVREQPEGYGARKAAAADADRRHLKTPAFYLLAIGSMCSIGAVGGTNQHLKLFMGLDLKYSQERPRRSCRLVLGCSIVGRLLMGGLADRFPRKYVMIFIYLLVAAAIPLLFIADRRV